MAKKVVGMIKLQIPAGKANPSPPVGPALGQHGVNIMEFCKAFNAKTQAQDRIRGPFFQFYNQNAACGRFVDEGRQGCQGVFGAQQG
jgi:hypothetical protein